ncbi:choline transporter-like protein 1 isoform X2 [Ornithodoros turicata]|uniref:choline transporter-like protein 1 isoform X2 n=1 Tax=Ornithodoros turicata TaxID=34597 RepID=UPI003138D747
MGCCGDEGSKVHSSDERRTSAVDVFVEYNGPVKDRSCTDVLWLLVFIAFCVALAYILAIAVLRGDPLRIVNGMDNYGNTCGVRNEDKVPDVPLSGKDMTNLSLLVLQDAVGYKRYCSDRCPSGYVLTPFRRCVLNNHPITIASQAINISSSFFEEAAEDLSVCWRELIYMCLIALGLTIVVLILMRFFTGLIVWLILFVISLACIGCTAYLWFLWYVKRRDYPKLPDDDPRKHSNEVSYWLYGSIAATVVTVIILLIILVMRKRIQLTAALFGEAGKALTAMPLLFFQPIWTLIFLCVVVLGWVAGMLYISTAGHPALDRATGLVYLKKDSLLLVAPWFHLMALYWLTQFIVSCQYVVIAGSTATWYFTRNKSELDSPISTSLYYLVRYHLGSVALGSFLVALVKLIRAILNFLEKQLKTRFESCTFLLKMCQCCLCCFEKFLKFLNRNAYILQSTATRSAKQLEKHSRCSPKTVSVWRPLTPWETSSYSWPKSGSSSGRGSLATN